MVKPVGVGVKPVTTSPRVGIGPLEPPIVAGTLCLPLPLALAVIVCVPGVINVALKTPNPATNVAGSPGNSAAVSLLAKSTVPLKLVAGLPNGSRATTVKLKGTPVVAKLLGPDGTPG